MDFKLNLMTEKVARTHLRSPLCIDPLNSVRQAIALMQEHDRGEALVMRDGTLVGMFTERDALRFLAGEGDLSAPIEKAMISPVVTLQEKATVGEAIGKMAQRGIRRVPILDDAGRPVGVMKASGVLHYLVEHFPRVIYTLPPKPHHSLQQAEGA